MINKTLEIASSLNHLYIASCFCMQEGAKWGFYNVLFPLNSKHQHLFRTLQARSNTECLQPFGVLVFIRYMLILAPS